MEKRSEETAVTVRPVPDEAHRNGVMWLAGEASGDALASLVIPPVKRAMDGALQFGIGGEKMRAAGLSVWHDASVLSVRGYVEVLKKLPQLLMLRRDVIRTAETVRPKVFIGVDAPDFNLAIEEKLRKSGIRTVHFVSPSIWAWRPERIHAIKRSVDHMLLVFPFEKAIYDAAGIPSTYIGYPMAEGIPMKPDTHGARQRLGLEPRGPVFAVLPGSRYDEIRWNAPVFFETAREVLKAEPHSMFLIPASDEARRTQIVQALGGFREVAEHVILFSGRSHDVLEACDAALIASGTATLEAALYKKPMIVGYKMPALSSLIIQSKGNTSFVSLPNILEQKRVVPEFLQYFAEPQYMAASLLDQLNPARREHLEEVFTELHQSLLRDTATLASQAILDTIGGAA